MSSSPDCPTACLECGGPGGFIVDSSQTPLCFWENRLIHIKDFQDWDYTNSGRAVLFCVTCVCVCLCMCICVCLCLCVCAYVCVSMYVCLCVSVHVYMCVCVCACVSVYLCMYVFVYLCTWCVCICVWDLSCARDTSWTSGMHFCYDLFSILGWGTKFLKYLANDEIISLFTMMAVSSLHISTFFPCWLVPSTHGHIPSYPWGGHCPLTPRLYLG